MSEENKEKQQETAKPAEANVTINSQYVKDLSLEIPGAPEIFKEMSPNPKVAIDIDVNSRHLEGNFYNSSLKLRLEGDMDGKKLFILELEYCAVVGLNLPQEHIEPVLLIEIPRMIFPFARSIITNNLVDAGLPPFMISPIDFGVLYQAKKKPQ